MRQVKRMKALDCRNCRECWNVGASAYKCGLLRGRVLVIVNEKATQEHGWCMEGKSQQQRLRENKRKVR